MVDNSLENQQPLNMEPTEPWEGPKEPGNETKTDQLLKSGKNNQSDDIMIKEL